MQDGSDQRKQLGESSLHQEMMQGFIDWVAGLRSIKHIQRYSQPADQRKQATTRESVSRLHSIDERHWQDNGEERG